MDSQQLLAHYASTGSESAFAELVQRYVNLVYSTAVRAVGGDRHLAEDVTQTVFMRLATKGRSLPANVLLGGWLHRDTCHVAATLLRGARRRAARERQAAAMDEQSDHSCANLGEVKPLLDAAIEKLDHEDRAAILLRFFEQRDFRSLGKALGSTEEAARKRVGRALEKLHSFLVREGVSLSAGALGALLAGEAVTAAPAGLASGIAGAALVAAAEKGFNFSLLKAISTIKVKIALLTAIAAIAAVVPAVLHHQSRSALREPEQARRRDHEALEQLRIQNAQLSGLLARANDSASAATNRERELLRLRGELGRLRQATSSQATSPGESPKTSSAPQFYFVSGGGVAVPNRRVFQPGLTVTKAIAEAGGFTETAVRTNVRLTRVGDNAGSVIDVTAIEQGRAQDPEIRPGDTLFVPDERFLSGR